MAEKQKKEQKDFLRILKHQLKGPLTVIRGYLSFWENDTYSKFSPEKQKEFLIKCLDSAKKLDGIAVIDRHISLGFEGPLASDIRSTIYCADIQINDYIAGLGGRDITLKHLEKAIIDLKDGKSGSWLL